MKMYLVDWLILIIPMAVVLWIGFRTKKYIKGVSDFMAAGRAAGRYLVSTSEMMAGMGLISVVAMFQLYYESGFGVSWWGSLAVPVSLVMTMTGFVIYRYRETRAMTLAQFFEMRYSKGVRITAGILVALSGIINYGIFPAVGGRFFVYFCGLPEEIPFMGFMIPTFAIVMALFLTLALIMVLAGGQLTIMVTDCVQGLFGYIMYTIIALVMLSIFPWSDISAALLDRPEGKSLFNPFDVGKFPASGFSLWYFLIAILGSIYSQMAWQGTQGFNCCAASPHEAKMGRILGAWRGGFSTMMFILLAICAYTCLHHSNYSELAQTINNDVAKIGAHETGWTNTQVEAIQKQMRVPIALAYSMPAGITGLFASIMFFLLVSTDVSYLHSWGSIVIQDVVLPFKKKPFTPKGQLLALRLSIVGVALYAFIFSILYKPTDYILMFFALTGTIWLGGAGALILGGLYWKKGTAAGAYGAMFIGAILAVAGFVCELYWTNIHAKLLALFPDSRILAENAEKFPISGQWMWFIAMVSAITIYVVLSLLTNKGNFDLDQLLHRGKYATGADKQEKLKIKPPRTWKSFLGIDDQMTRGDRAIAYSVFIWSMFWFGCWGIITLWNGVPYLAQKFGYNFTLWSAWPKEWWANWFYFQSIQVAIVVGVVTTIWFTWGGTRDLFRLFKALRDPNRQALDDGRVIDHQSVGDTQVPTPVIPADAATVRSPEAKE